MTLSLRSVSRTFGPTKAVDQVSLDVAPGQILGLLGPNGSGKSTTIKLASGVLPVSAGQVLVNNQDLAHHPQAKSLLGYVPDVGGLFPRLTGLEHLELAGRLYKVPHWKARADELLNAFNLEQAAKRPSSTYSHGMSRKLSAAIALLSAPDVLLLDEPFDGVDPIGTSAIIHFAKTLQSQGSAVLVATHLLDVALDLCDSIAIMKNSKIIEPATHLAAIPSLPEFYLSRINA
jgi:ABC-2 type transport system ATP-binding protein